MTSLVAKKKKKGGRYLKYIKHNILVKSRNATQPKNSSQEFFSRSQSNFGEKCESFRRGSETYFNDNSLFVQESASGLFKSKKFLILWRCHHLTEKHITDHHFL